MINSLFNVGQYLLWILGCVIFVQVVLSWFVAFNVVNIHQPVVRSIYMALEKITSPLYRPIRKILPDFGGLDFSPIILFFLIQILSMLLRGAQNDWIASLS